MPTYLEQVKALCAVKDAEHQTHKQAVDAARATSYRDEMRPLRDRLADLLKTYSPEAKATGLSLSDLQVQLRGRKAAKAHCGEVATALRELGYRRVRVWKQSNHTGFNAQWKAPGTFASPAPITLDQRNSNSKS